MGDKTLTPPRVDLGMTPISDITIRRGEALSVWLRPEVGGQSIQVELHVDLNGKPRILLSPNRMAIVGKFSDVYGDGDDCVPTERQGEVKT